MIDNGASGHWSGSLSHGLFINLGTPLATKPALVFAMIAMVVEGFALGPKDLHMSTKNGFIRWRYYSRKVVEQVLADGQTLELLLMVGTPAAVRLGAGFELRNGYRLTGDPVWHMWIACEATTWPESLFASVARKWLTLGAEHGVPHSGGAFGSTDLMFAKIEATGEYETLTGSQMSAFRGLYRLRLNAEHANSSAHERIRRLYPLTLLGPRYASPHNVALLRAAGAEVEPVGASLLVTTYPTLVSAWDPHFLAATVALRRLAWPISQKSPPDAAGLPEIKDQFMVPPAHELMREMPPHKELIAELKRQTLELGALLPDPLPRVEGKLDLTPLDLPPADPPPQW